MNSPAEAVTPVVENGGFTIVEEDDVAFSLGLSREIHRIYGSYQSGELEPSDSVHLGLALTVQMLGSLSASVTRGMPAMRIEVAWAQISEMMSVMFADPVVRKATRAGRSQLKASMRPLAEPVSRSGASEISAPADLEPALPARGLPVEGPSLPAAALVDDRTPQGPGTVDRPLPFWQRAREWVRCRPLAVRFMLGIIACVVSAMLIDLPIAALLLFPEISVQLSTAYAVAIGVSWWVVRRGSRPPWFDSPLA